MFGTHKAPHALPKFVTDKMLLREVCYQMTQGFSRVLNKGKNKPWPTFPLTIGSHVVENFKQVEAEAKVLKGSHFVNLNCRTYDLEKFVAAHCKKAKLSWSYSHTKKDHKDGIQNWYNATRELSPSEQQARDEEFVDNSQEDVTLKERDSTIKKKQHEAPKGTGEFEK